MSRKLENQFQLRLPDFDVPRRVPHVRDRHSFFGLGHVVLQDNGRLKLGDLHQQGSLLLQVLEGKIDYDNPDAVAAAIAAVKGRPSLPGLEIEDALRGEEE